MKLPLPSLGARSRSDRPIVPTGSFDFVASRSAKRRRVRQQRIIAAFVFFAVTTVSLFFGLQARLETPSLEQRALSAESRLKNLTESYQDAVGVTGPDALSNHSTTRKSEVATATAAGFNPAPLVDAVVAAAPAGVTVTQVSLTGTSAVPTPSASPDDHPFATPSSPSANTPAGAPTTQPPSADPSQAPQPTADAPTATITILASAEGYSQVEQFEQAVASMQGLSNVALEFSGVPPEMRMTITASVDPALYRPARLEGLSGGG